MAKGGFRPGAGRKKAAHTIAAEKARAVVVREVTTRLKKLLGTQFKLAEGHSYLFRVERTKGKNGEREKHVLVTDPDEIQAYLDDELDDDDYHYITTDKPDERAIEDLMNRALGKAAQIFEVPEGSGEVSIKWQK